MTTRRSFLSAVAAALVPGALFEEDTERALWVPGAKLISIPAPAPVVIHPMFNVGDVVTFGNDPQRFIVMDQGAPDGLGATFAFLSGPGLPWGVQMPKLPALDPARFRPPAPASRWIWEQEQINAAAARRRPRYAFRSLYPPALVLKG